MQQHPDFMPLRGEFLIGNVDLLDYHPFQIPFIYGSWLRHLLPALPDDGEYVAQALGVDTLIYASIHYYEYGAPDLHSHISALNLVRLLVHAFIETHPSRVGTAVSEVDMVLETALDNGMLKTIRTELEARFPHGLLADKTSLRTPPITIHQPIYA